MSSYSATTVRILRGHGGRNAAAAPFAPAISDVGSAGGLGLAERLDEARDAGYQAGYEAARSELAENAEAARLQELEKLAEMLTRAAADAARNRADLVVQAQGEAVALAIELAASIVQRELAISDSLTTEAIRRAIGLVPRGEDLIVRLHPGDVIDASDLADLVPDNSVKVVADPSVEPGGCVVAAGPCHIDAQVGPALERARAVIARVADDPGSDTSSQDAVVAGSSSDLRPSEPRT